MGLIKIWNIMINLIRGQITRNPKFKSQFKALLKKKIKIKDQSEKDVKLQGWEINLIKDWIEKN